MKVDHIRKHSVLGVNVSAVDYDRAVAAVCAAARARRPLAVSALAVHGVMCGALDAVHRFRLNSFDLICPDGQPVRWVLNLLYGAGLSERVYGPDLMLRLCEVAARQKLPVYFYGSRPEVLANLSRRLSQRFPGLAIAGAHPSLFRRGSAAEQDDIIAEIRGSGARIIFVGLGCPRQEVWTYENAPRLSLPTLAVGAAFDFHAGGLPQAPARLQRLGLEWAYRLWREPARLWRRYVLLNPLFVLLVALQALRLKRFDGAGTVPVGMENYA